jgi:glycosyltransferase involved in cell wall biosynthesis
MCEVNKNNKYLFSIGLIVKNEEKTLPKLYENIKTFINNGGEVVLLDTGSTDNTVNLAKSYGFKTYCAQRSFIETLSKKSIKILKNVHIEENENNYANELFKDDHTYFNFGKARNELHKYVSNDLLIQIDGSDTLPIFDFEYINTQIINGARRFEYTQIYGIVELTISRFYDKNVDIWEGRTHEILTHKSKKEIMVLPKDKLIVNHNYQPKKRTYLSGLFADILEKPNHTRTLYYLGRELMFSGLFKSSIKMLTKYVNQKDCWIPERSSAYCLIGNCYEHMGKEYYGEAFKAYNDAFISFNGWREPLLKAGRLCQRTDEFQRGLCYAMASLSINRISAFAEPSCNYLGLPHEIAYWGYYFTKRNREACTHWKIAYTLEPNNEKYINDAQYFDKPELFDIIILKSYLGANFTL